jgi:hypothetical protein
MKIDSYIHLFTENIVELRKFYTKIGLKVKEDYSNEHVLCVELNKHSYLMVLEQSRFQSFHPTLKLAQNDVHSHFISLQLKSIEHVDQFMKKVVINGGVETEKATEDEWVYYRSFKDIDQHQFEVFYMKPHLPKV